MIIRVDKNSNYSVINNEFLRDKNLSLEAKGLFSLILSLPDDWNFYKNGLMQFSTNGRYSLDSAIKELKTYRYLDIQKIKDNGNDWAWFVFEKPLNEELYMKKQYIEKQYIEKQYMENLQLQNTNNNKILNIQNTNKYIYGGRKPSCIDEVKAYCKDKGITDIDIDYFYNFYEANGWVQGHQGKPIKNWTCCISTFRKNNAKYSNKQQKPKKTVLDMMGEMIKEGIDDRRNLIQDKSNNK